ncbi:hypothetical protein [Photobacterium leiognathi]|uniref:hypothetical protein n=1 Tax=Photobacterium leiognathi TaxID=553611 RepID=UPI002982722C|nr:hypothetical protein [Photobacterium leiognathi]
MNFVALGHIIGATIVSALVFFIIGIFYHSRRENTLNDENAYLSMETGIPIYDLDKKSSQPVILKYLKDKYDDRKFCNRLSDLFGFIQRCVGVLITLIYFGGLAISISGYPNEGVVFAWLLVAISIFYYIADYLIVLISRLFTGRYPYEAKNARLGINQLLNENNDLIFEMNKIDNN